VTSAYLFDSHALLAFFQKEAGAEIVARILNEALKQNTDTLISVMNLGEIIFNSGNNKREYGFCLP
jgi:PIN domain nuclease of toxin-antitoxin system